MSYRPLSAWRPKRPTPSTTEDYGELFQAIAHLDPEASIERPPLAPPNHPRPPLNLPGPSTRLAQSSDRAVSRIESWPQSQSQFKVPKKDNIPRKSANHSHDQERGTQKPRDKLPRELRVLHQELETQTNKIRRLEEKLQKQTEHTTKGVREMVTAVNEVKAESTVAKQQVLDAISQAFGDIQSDMDRMTRSITTCNHPQQYPQQRDQQVTGVVFKLLDMLSGQVPTLAPSLTPALFSKEWNQLSTGNRHSPAIGSFEAGLAPAQKRGDTLWHATNPNLPHSMGVTYPPVTPVGGNIATLESSLLEYSQMDSYINDPDDVDPSPSTPALSLHQYIDMTQDTSDTSDAGSDAHIDLPTSLSGKTKDKTPSQTGPNRTQTSTRTLRKRVNDIDYVTHPIDHLTLTRLPKGSSPLFGSTSSRMRGRSVLPPHKLLLPSESVRVKGVAWPGLGPDSQKGRMVRSAATDAESSPILKRTQQEVVCDVCGGRVHWSCAGLQDQINMNNQPYTCPNCLHILRGSDESSPPIPPVSKAQQARCLRPDCILRGRKEPRKGRGRKAKKGKHDEDLFMFDKIIGRHGLRTARGKRIWEYLVKWSDYPVYESTWEPPGHLEEAEVYIARFEQECKEEDVYMNWQTALLPEATEFFEESSGQRQVGKLLDMGIEPKTWWIEEGEEGEILMDWFGGSSSESE